MKLLFLLGDTLAQTLLDLGVLFEMIRRVRAQHPVGQSDLSSTALSDRSLRTSVTRPSARIRRATCASRSASVRKTGWSWRRWTCRTSVV